MLRLGFERLPLRSIHALNSRRVRFGICARRSFLPWSLLANSAGVSKMGPLRLIYRNTNLSTDFGTKTPLSIGRRGARQVEFLTAVIKTQTGNQVFEHPTAVELPCVQVHSLSVRILAWLGRSGQALQTHLFDGFRSITDRWERGRLRPRRLHEGRAQSTTGTAISARVMLDSGGRAIGCESRALRGTRFKSSLGVG
jgi:hypothetical protein